MCGSVNKLGKTEPETQRTGVERVWNPGRVGGPSVAESKRRDERRGKVFEILWILER